MTLEVKNKYICNVSIKEIPGLGRCSGDEWLLVMFLQGFGEFDKGFSA